MTTANTRPSIDAEPIELTYLSLGAGVQSSAMFVMSCHQLRGCPKADVAIFADTQAEPEWVYKQVQILAEYGKVHGIPVLTVTKGSLEKQSIGPGTRMTIPAFTKGQDGKAAPLLRACSPEFKVREIERFVRRNLLGLKPRQRLSGKRIRCLIGISYEEAHRGKPSRHPCFENVYPLIDADMRKEHCEAILQDHGVPIPKKSACYFCPYHSDNYWRDLRDNHPHEWDKACVFDERIRDSKRKGVKNPAFLHRSLMPLRLVQLGTGHELFGEECEGVCGV